MLKTRKQSRSALTFFLALGQSKKSTSWAVVNPEVIDLNGLSGSRKLRRIYGYLNKVKMMKMKRRMKRPVKKRITTTRTTCRN